MKRLRLRLTAVILACFASIGAVACSGGGEGSGGGTTTTTTTEYYPGQSCYSCACTCDGAETGKWYGMATIAQSTCDALNGTSCADGGASDGGDSDGGESDGGDSDGGGGPTLQGCTLVVMTHCT